MSRLNAQRRHEVEASGLWHQPALMNLLADIVIVAAVAMLAWAALTALQRLPVFPLRQLMLQGAPQQVSVAQVEHAARSAIVGNFFTVDLEAARTAFEKLPWVRKATVRRHWPDGLTLALEEHEALAHWRQADGALALVNRQGEVFHAERAEGAPALPIFTGPEGSAAELLARYHEFGVALTPINRQVTSLSLSPRLAWRLRLDDGVAINLGRDQERHSLAERLNRLIAHYDNVKTRMASVRSVDMRYPNGFVLGGLERQVAPERRTGQERKS